MTGEALLFVLAAAVSLGASMVLVRRLERLGERFGFSEAMLGLLAALAADAPEITSAVTALARGQHDIGVGIVLGSNVFNIAALLGLGAVVAGRIALHRRVVVVDGAVGGWLAVVSLLLVTGVLGPALGLAVGLVAVVPYVAVSAMGQDRRNRLALAAGWRRWLVRAIREEELELATAIRPEPGGPIDAAVAAVTLVAVVVASMVMERTGSSLGAHYGIAPIVVGGLLLAAVTSLPNAVAAVYLARRGRGAATLATALNSNSINVLVGLLVPALAVGYRAGSGAAVTTAWWFVGLTIGTLLLAYTERGLGRRSGAAIIAAYAAFVVLTTVRP